MDTGRDLACPALWQESLERSLARRGKPTRSSLELSNLRPVRDLSHSDLLRESLMYSQLRRSAVTRRPSMALPGAGGISALTLLAATTLPGLLGGRAGGRERAAYRADTSEAQAAGAPMDGLAVDPSLATKATLALASTSGVAASATTATPQLHTPASEPAHVLAPLAMAHPPHHVRTPSLHPARSTSMAAAPKHIALAHDAADHHTSRSVAHALSGGAAPAAPRISVAAARVPAVPQPTRHPSTGGHLSAGAHLSVGGHLKSGGHLSSGGGAIEATTHTQDSAVSHPVEPVKATHPVTTSKPAAPEHPVSTPKPVSTTKPVSAAKPAPQASAPATPAPAAGSYVNPLAGASLTPERIDQGVDYSGSGTLTALGDGKVTYVGTSGTGWPGAFVEYRLTSGPDAGRFVYYAESISPAAGLHVGQTVHAGQPIASINGGLEIGWGSGVGSQPAAQADGQWSGGDDGGNVASADGKSFSALIASLGGPPGKVEG